MRYRFLNDESAEYHIFMKPDVGNYLNDWDISCIIIKREWFNRSML